MFFGEHVPYTNFHDLNMDQIAEIVMDFQRKYTTIETLLQEAQEAIETGKTEALAAITEKLNQSMSELEEAQQTAITAINAELSSATNTLNERASAKLAEVLDQIPADYTELANEVHDFYKYNSFPILENTDTRTENNRGIIFDWSGNTCHVYGTNDGTNFSSSNLYFNQSAFPPNVQAGGSYYIQFEPVNETRVQIFTWINDTLTVLYQDTGNLGSAPYFTIPENAVGFVIRLAVLRDAIVNEYITPILLSAETNMGLTKKVWNIGNSIGELETVSKTLTNSNWSLSPDTNTSKLWEVGAIDSATGDNVTNTERLRTAQFIPSQTGRIWLDHPDTVGMFFYVYSSDGSYLGAYKSDGTLVIDGSQSGYTSFNLQQIYVKYPSVQIRIGLYGKGVALTTAEIPYIHTQNLYKNVTAPVTLRIMQYNAGRWNHGQDGGYSGNTPGLYASNIRQYLHKYHPDIIGIQENRDYMDSANNYNVNTTFFDPILPYKSYTEHDMIVYSATPIYEGQHTYLHTTGDYPARMVYGKCILAGQLFYMATAVTNVMSNIDEKLRAITKMCNLLEDVNNAIVCIDTNVNSELEMIEYRAYMISRGYTSANWAYSVDADTYNPNSSQAYKKIDNIFVKGNVKIRNVIVPTEEYDKLLSDHIPLIADIQIHE